MTAGRTAARFLFGGDRERFGEGFVVALMVGTTAGLTALLAATMTGFGVTGPLPVGLLVTAVGGVAVLGALLYAALGAGVLSAGTIAAAPYLGLLALGGVAETFPYPVATPASDLRFFALVGVGLAVIGAGFHELPRLLDTDDAEEPDESEGGGFDPR